MYAPATPALAVPTLPSNAIAVDEATAPPVTTTPVVTIVRIRRAFLNVLDGHAASVAGSLGIAPRGSKTARTVVLQARGRHGWRTIATARTGVHGRFRLRYRTARLGSERLRVRFAGALGERGAQRAVGRLNVYRPVEASWYGGGGSLACGGWLTSATLGVANKTLPCGTLVTLRYDGHTVRVPVIDRGPYVAGREYDLTEATKRALGFEGVGEVWATR
jgi:peptidoglycan lytic transglycosylase